MGVAPYMQIQVEDEDSLTERFDKNQEIGQIDIAVVRTPRISNFTDFNPFESIPGVSLRYVKTQSELGNPDLIFLPGTKNTMGDLKWLRESGMEAVILKAASRGTMIFGICGGYQMLGETLSDPYDVEEGGSMKGMGLLPIETVFTKEKTRTRVRGTIGTITGPYAGLSGTETEGYEIHMGETVLKEGAEHVLSITDTVTAQKKKDGAYRENVFGTYVHGFLIKRVVQKLLFILSERKKDWMYLLLQVWILQHLKKHSMTFWQILFASILI